MSCFYGSFRAVRNVDIEVAKQRDHGAHRAVRLRQVDPAPDDQPDERPRPVATGPRAGSCSTARTCSRKGVDPVEVRRRVGMVFQKPNPFPKTICDNVAFGPGSTATRANMDELVERSLRRAALWDEVKDKLKQSGLALSGGQQQRLCIARTIAVEPEVILMDEPCSALDPRSTLQIEELMAELKKDYTIVIVTHNMQQAARASDTTVFMTMGDDRAGYVVEQARTIEHLHQPEEPADRGLRLRAVRLTRGGRHDRPNVRPTERGRRRARSTQIMDAAETSAGRRRASRTAGPARTPLDREEREIKDAVLRMGSLVEDAIRAAIEALIGHDADAGDWRSSRATRASTRCSARSRRSSRVTIATQQPVARDLRFLLALDHVSYELERMGDHAASVAKQARKLAPEPPLKRYVDLPEMGELAATLVHGILRALVDVDATRPARSPPATTRSTSSTTGPSTRSSS